MAERPTVETVQVLDALACQHWSEQVLALRPHWTRRDAHLPFYTLGMAAYLDAARIDPRLGRRPYQVDGLRLLNNQLIAAHFQPLLDRCCLALAAWSGLPVRCLGERAALPGFHIHLPHPLFAGPVASRHVDLQFQQVFAERTWSPREVLTVTLPLSLPGGASLQLWSGEHSYFHPYRLGELALHDGLTPHQAVLHPQGGEQPRIMLQCHAVRDADGWGLYW